MEEVRNAFASTGRKEIAERVTPAIMGIRRKGQEPLDMAVLEERSDKKQETMYLAD